MKILMLLIVIAAMLAPAFSNAEDQAQDPQRLFYAGNSFYEKREYDKAITEYSKIIDAGIASSRLYYNIGNAYFKLGKTGYAILYYERARRISPQDADLKSNLAYAKSLVGNPSYEIPKENPLTSSIRHPLGDFNINTIMISMLLLYTLLIILQTIALANPVIGKRIRLVTLTIFCLFLYNFAGFLIRYYDENILKTGVVVQKTADCKYEPIDKSTTYYRLQEGDDVIVLRSRNGWRKIRRPDGKIGWVYAAAVDVI
jgi:tetratricopeptide (TPR) repeat protein